MSAHQALTPAERAAAIEEETRWGSEDEEERGAPFLGCCSHVGRYYSMLKARGRCDNLRVSCWEQHDASPASRSTNDDTVTIMYIPCWRYRNVFHSSNLQRV